MIGSASWHGRSWHDWSDIKITQLGRECQVFRRVIPRYGPVHFRWIVVVDYLIVAYVFAVAIYLTVTIPALRTISQPLPEDSLGTRIEAARVLSAGNILMMVALIGILLMQVR